MRTNVSEGPIGAWPSKLVILMCRGGRQVDGLALDSLDNQSEQHVKTVCFTPPTTVLQVVLQFFYRFSPFSIFTKLRQQT